MNVKEVRRDGHCPTLFSAFLSFDVSFMVWVMLGAPGACIAQDLDLTASQICTDPFGFYGVGFLTFGLAALAAFLSLLISRQVWRDSWAGDGTSAALAGAEQ